MTGQENGALAGKGTEKQKGRRAAKENGGGGGGREEEVGGENNRGERGEIKGTVERKNSASSSCGASQRGPLGTPITSANREVQLWRRARTDKSQSGSFLRASRRLNEVPPSFPASRLASSSARAKALSPITTRNLR